MRSGRSVETILAEWRALERNRALAGRPSRRVLGTRMEELRNEYRVAPAAREAEAVDRDLEVEIAPTIKQVTVASAGRPIPISIRRDQQADVESLVAVLRRRSTQREWLGRGLAA